MYRGLRIAGTLWLAAVFTAHAADRGVGGTASAGPGSGGARVALVIGNSGYASAPLRNPVNDAKAMSEALRACGFDVMVKTDAGLRAMEEAIDAFGERIGEGAAAVFFYAGHGLQVEGHNYLVPVDAAMKAEKDARYECVDADRVLVRMESARAGVSLVILDACRNNPFERNFRTGAAGLASMNAADVAVGCLIAYSTSPGKVAEDGSGANSVYTASLLKQLQVPGLPVEEVFKRVRAEVLQTTASAQKPWESTSLTGSFYFTAPQAGTPTPALPPPPDAAPLVGGLQVSVNAPKATVYVDGKESGTATSAKPFEQSNLPAGAAQVTVRADGYEEFSEAVNIEPGKWTQKPVVLAKTSVVRPPEPGRPPTVTQPAQPPQVTVTTGQPKAGDVQTVDLGGGVTLELVWCPPGTFTMGSPSSEADRGDDETQHQVTLTQGFWMGKYEVTQAQWERVMGSNPSEFKGDPRLPVEQVSWDDCQEFTDKLNSRVSGGGFKLPTEAQWEYACRAGSKSVYCFGDSASGLSDYAWSSANSGSKTHPVGQKSSNGWGLHDMHGNVWEWCSDWYGDYASGSVTDPTGASSGDWRVLRGGSWNFNPGRCRSAHRINPTPPDYRSANGGFRLLRTP